MATPVRNNGSRRGSTTNYDNHGQGNGQSDSHDSSDDDNKKTLALVDLFKDIVQKRIKQNQSITEADVESATFNARKKLDPHDYDPVKWKKDSSLDIDEYPNDLFLLSMAYAKTPEQIRSIFNAKQEQFTSHASTHSKREPTCTSLEDTFEPLKQLNDKTQNSSFKNLFAAVLAISQDEIDRADRMFYSEACHLIGERKNYTFDIAHEQVQAIRLMHYESDDETSLRRFIETCTTFDDAYSYLRQLAKERVDRREPNATTQKNKKPEKSLVQRASANQNDDPYNDSNRRLTNSASYHNDSSQQQSQQARRSLERGNSQRDEPDDNRGYNYQKSTK